VNSKFIHGIMSCRRQVNMISSIFVDSPRVEGVVNVYNVVFSHFAAHF